MCIIGAMPASDQQHQLLQLAQDIGAIKQGVKNLDDGQREVGRKITGLHQTVADLVKKDDCKAFRADITDRIKRPPSGGHKVHRMGLELLGQKAGAIAAILALLSMVVVGFIALSRFAAQVERAIEISRREQVQRTSEVIDEIRRQPVIIHRTPATLPPDAGLSRRRRRKAR